MLTGCTVRIAMLEGGVRAFTVLRDGQVVGVVRSHRRLSIPEIAAALRESGELVPQPEVTALPRILAAELVAGLPGAGEDVWWPPSCDVPEVTNIVRTCGQRPEGLRAMIESILAQEGVSVEVIVVVDEFVAALGEEGSGIFSAAEKQPDPVGCLQFGHRRGTTATRNAGMRLARGEFVRCHDDDDVLPPGALAAQVELLRAHPTAVFCAGRIEPVPKVRGEWPQHRALAELCGGTIPEVLPAAGLAAHDWNLLPGPTLMWRRWPDLPLVPEDWQIADDGAHLRWWLGHLLPLTKSRAKPKPLVVWCDTPVLRYAHGRDDHNSGDDRTDLGRWKRADGVLRVEKQRRLPAYARLLRQAGEPKRLAIIIGHLTGGGAQWATIQMASALDRRLVEPRIFEVSPKWADGHFHTQAAELGLTVRSMPEGLHNAAAWLQSEFAEWPANLLDTSWDANVITQQIAALVPRRFAHAQSCRLHHAGLHKDEIVKRFGGIIAVSQEVVESNQQLADRATVIRSPVDTVAADRAAHLRDEVRERLSVEPEQRLVIWASRLLGDGKGRLLLRRWCERSAAELPEVRWLICGWLDTRSPTYTRDRDDWHGWAHQAGVRLVTDALPWDMPPLYAAADVYLSSSDYEGDSLALGEAMAARCVPVVTRTGGVPASVEHGLTGYVAEVGDFEALWTCLRRALELSDEELAAMGELCRRHVIATSDLRTVAREHELLYLGAT